MKRKLRRFQQSFVLSHEIYFIASVFSCRGVYSSIIPPPRGGEESKALSAREETQRVKKKGREGKGRGKGREKNQGCIFLYSSRPRVAETKCVKGKEWQGTGKWEGEKKEKKKK